jgi:hypothetical protein
MDLPSQSTETNLIDEIVCHHFRSDDTVVCVYAEGGRTIICSCLSGIPMTNECTHHEVYKKLYCHFKRTHKRGETSFLYQFESVTEEWKAAIDEFIGTVLPHVHRAIMRTVPCNVLKELQLEQCPLDFKESPIKWCISCGATRIMEAYGEKNRCCQTVSRCACPGLIPIGSLRRGIPLVVEFPTMESHAKLALSRIKMPMTQEIQQPHDVPQVAQPQYANGYPPVVPPNGSHHSSFYTPAASFTNSSYYGNVVATHPGQVYPPHSREGNFAHPPPQSFFSWPPIPTSNLESFQSFPQPLYQYSNPSTVNPNPLFMPPPLFPLTTTTTSSPISTHHQLFPSTPTTTTSSSFSHHQVSQSISTHHQTPQSIPPLIPSTPTTASSSSSSHHQISPSIPAQPDFWLPPESPPRPAPRAYFPFADELSNFTLSTTMRPVVQRPIHNLESKTLAYFQLENLNDIHLTNLMKLCRKASTFEEKVIIRMGHKVFEYLNQALNSLCKIESSALYHASGGGDGEVGSVNEETLKKYQQNFYDRVMLGGIRSTDKSFDGLKLILQELKETYTVDTQNECEKGILPRFIAQLFEIVLGSTPNSFLLTRLFPACCLHGKRTKWKPAKSRDGAGEDDDSSSSDKDEDEQFDGIDNDSEWSGPRKAFVHLPEIISQIGSAGRFLGNGLLAALYRFLYEQGRVQTFSQFVRDFVISRGEFNKTMNKCIGYFRNLTEARHSENTAIVKVLNDDREVEYETRYLSFDLLKFREASDKLLERFEELFEEASESARSVLKELLSTDRVEEMDWRIIRLNGRIAFRGKGPRELRKFFSEQISSKPEAELSHFVRELRMIVLALTFFHSSGLFRTKTLAGLHLDLLNPTNGNVHLADKTFYGYSILVVDGVSSKQKGQVQVDGHFSARFSKIFAIVAITLVECMKKDIIKKHLDTFSFCSIGDYRYYEDLLGTQIESMSSYPICNLDPCLDPSTNDDNRPRLVRNRFTSNVDVSNLVKTKKRIESDLNQMFVFAFDDEHMSLSLIRKIFSNFNKDVPEFVRQELTNMEDEDLRNLGQRLLDSIDMNNSNSSRSDLVGDGGAHSNETSNAIYGALAQGSKIPCTNFARSRLLTNAKEYLFRDYFALRERCDEDKTESLYDIPYDELVERMELRIQDETEDESFSFRIEQRNMIKAFQNRESLVIRLGCGFGKTMMHIVMAHEYEFGVTVFISPTRALVRSIGQECEKLGVANREYDAGNVSFLNGRVWDENQATKVVQVVVDTAFAKDGKFSTWLYQMDQRKLINRVVFDEAHFWFDFATFRPIVSFL